MSRPDPHVLTTQLLSTLDQINKQIDEALRAAKRMGISPHSLRDERGGWVLAPLLVAKAQTLHALTILHTPN